MLPIFFDFIPQRAVADPQDLSGAGLITLGLIQRGQNRSTFQFPQRRFAPVQRRVAGGSRIAHTIDGHNYTRSRQHYTEVEITGIS